jgi:hypothetical protein
MRHESATDADDESTSPPTNGNLADGVALLRSILAETTTQPRWPMYVRQLKQFIRNARPDFDERRYGSILDLMRACQKDGFLRLERDRQGGLRVFASGPVKATSLPHGWSTLSGEEPVPALEAPPVVEEALPSAPVELDEDSRGNVAPPNEARPKRARKSAAPAPSSAPKPRARKTATRTAEAKPKARTPLRRTRAQASTAHDEGQADRDGRDGENR